MVYAQAARKTAGFMVLAMVMSLSIVMFLSGDIGATGRVTTPGVQSADSGAMLIFLLGIFVGALLIGTYFYLAHLEGKRQE